MDPWKMDTLPKHSEIGNQPVSVSECLLAPALRKRLHMVKRQLLKRLKANGSIRKFKGI